MNRVTAVVVAGLGLALSALALWVLDLSGRVSAGTTPAPAAGPGGGEARDTDLRARLEVLDARIDELSAEVARLREGRLPARPTPAAGGEETPVPSGLEEAVEAVLRKREEEARLGEIRRRAETFVMRLDPDVKLSEKERWDLLPVLTDYFDRRDRIVRSRVLGDREREAAVEALDADRNRRLGEVLPEDRAREVVRRLDRIPSGRAVPDFPERGRGEGVDGIPPR